MDDVLRWAAKFTSWHEDFSKNPPLARKMDLHNNAVGRTLFKVNPHLKTEEVITLLKQKADASLKISKIEEMEAIGSTGFVHLKD
jgi:hypothetical protein